MDYSKFEFNQEYKNKPIEQWTMWDSACYDYDKLCEEHDTWMETKEGRDYYKRNSQE